VVKASTIGAKYMQKIQPKQKHYKNEFQKAHLNILHTASWFSLQSTKLLKLYHISPEQFNILRILYSLHPEPATVKALTAQMVDEMSNASRLVEKLKQKGLVEREACDEDRRRVNVYLTPKGLATFKEAVLAIDESIEEKMGLLSEEQAALLNQLLERIRS